MQTLLESATWLRTYADVDEAFRSKDFEQGDRESPDSLRYLALTDVEGVDHFARRRLYAPLFRRAALEQDEREVVRPAVRRLAAAAATGGGADLLVLVRSALVELAAAIVGLDDVVGQPGRVERLRLLLGVITEANHVRWSKRDREEVLREGHAAVRSFADEYFTPSWRRREALLAGGTSGPDDLIMVLIRERRSFAPYDEGVFLREAVLFTSGSVSTIPTLLPHCVAELERWLEHHPGGRARLTDPEFMRQVATEGIRLHPSGLLPRRRAIRDTVLSSGRRVREGEVCLLDTAAAGRDPAVFAPDPDAFRPGRSFPRSSPYGVVFGGGNHLCIGRGLSLGEPSATTEPPHGVIVAMLLDLYAAGMRLDPARPPVVMPPVVESQRAFPVRNYAEFRVRFDRP